MTDAIARAGADTALVLVNESTHTVIARRVELALTRRARRIGLLGRAALDTAAALVLAPCVSIHTVGMQFPIDVVFVSRDGRAVRIIHRLKPWRAAVSVRASAVIEFAGGTLLRRDVRVGDQLDLRPAEDTGC
jgi:uncharacterized membrane protein (UPF0127 family)